MADGLPAKSAEATFCVTTTKIEVKTPTITSSEEPADKVAANCATPSDGGLSSSIGRCSDKVGLIFNEGQWT